jgi:hypothetical protein
MQAFRNVLAVLASVLLPSAGSAVTAAFADRPPRRPR